MTEAGRDGTVSTAAAQAAGPAFAVQTLHLSRMFGNRVAADDINLDIKKGELVALLGPSGAGKSTIINMLCGLLRPSGGTASVMGNDVLSQLYEVKKVIGVSPQESAFSERLTPLENLELIAVLHGLPSAKARKWSKLMLETIGMEGHVSQQSGKLSMSIKRRLGLAIALIHDPSVLLLDEPTLGLDRESQHMLWEYIMRLKGEKTILLATRCVEEADYLADRTGLIDAGKIVALDTVAELKTGVLDQHTLVVKGWNITQSAVLGIQQRYQNVKIEGGTILISGHNLDFAEVVAHLRDEGVSLRSAYFREPTLGDVFSRLTGKELSQ